MPAPPAGGLLSGKFGPGINTPENSRRTSFAYPPVNEEHAWKCIGAMREIGRAHDVSVARVALAWLLAKRHVMSVIIGAKIDEQLADNLAATKLVLSADEMARLDVVSAPTPEYPTWSMSFRSVDRVPEPFKG